MKHNSTLCGASEEGGTEVRYVGNVKSDAQEKIEECCEFILGLCADHEVHSRQEILAKGHAVGLKRDPLDTARKGLIEENVLLPAQLGK